MGDFWSARFFSNNLVGRIFLSLLNALQDIFSLLISLQDFVSSKSVVFTFKECIYIYSVVIAVIVPICSCIALKCCELYTKSFLYSYMFSECHSLKSFNTTCYLSDRPQVSMSYRLINHAGCW